MSNICVIFDLDDTLYKEIDFVKSGFTHVANYLHYHIGFAGAYEILFAAFENGRNPLDELNKKINNSLSKEVFLNLYRNHFPDIKLTTDTVYSLNWLTDRGFTLGLITDGRTVTQRNKILALGLDKFISKEMTIISEEFGSEKPCLDNYKYFMKIKPDCNQFVYVGDNPQKDFFAPNTFGWTTIGLIDDGTNIHPQANIDPLHNPKIWVNSLMEIRALL